MPRHPRSHRPADANQGARSPNREPAGGRMIAAGGAEYNANSGRIDQIYYAADVTGHIMPTYIPGNAVARRLAGVGGARFGSLSCSSFCSVTAPSFCSLSAPSFC